MTTPDDPNATSLDAVLADFTGRDDEELFAEIGAAELGESLGMRPAEFGRFLRVGRQWFDRNQQRLRDALCNHPAVQDLHDKVHSEATTDAAVIADILLGSFHQIPATAAAVIIARRGLDTLCR
jgi:hypothetical protein